ncbi:MAG: tryptophan synthase subunit alpha, partial [Deltaproteobacteria bacterium]|nr:tryptophan synthase subunit alpha [Deltaproteobacteria bacterium]
MKRIEETLKALQKTGRAALIPYIMAGDPDLKTTGLLIRKMAESGAQIIEVGVPFSDPLADGPTIQAAAQRALRNGVHLEDLFNLVKGMKGANPPLVL